MCGGASSKKSAGPPNGKYGTLAIEPRSKWPTDGVLLKREAGAERKTGVKKRSYEK